MTETIKNLTPEEKAALKAQFAAEDKAAKDTIVKDRETYKTLVDETVRAMFTRLKEVSLLLVEEKQNVFTTFEQTLAMKASIYGVKENQQSHTFTSSDGQLSIKLGHRIIDQYDDSKSAGVAKVNKYLATLSKDENSAMLVESVMGLLKSDDKGNLRPSRVLELEKLASKTGDPEFMDGIRIIKDSHHPVRTCQFVSVEYKDENGVTHSLPMSMSSAD